MHVVLILGQWLVFLEEEDHFRLGSKFSFKKRKEGGKERRGSETIGL